MDDEGVAMLAGLSCSSLSDALDRLGAPGSAHGIAPLANGQRMVGRAFTVRYAPAGVPAGTVGDYVDDLAPGTVVVLDNGGRTDCTVWGDILTAMALHRRLAGTAIHGVCRDVHRALETGYPVYSAGRFMRTGKDRVEVVEVGGPVALGDVQVCPDDVVAGDDDGIVVVPSALVARVAEVARTVAQREEAILADALATGSLREARRRFGYHVLQRREGGPGAVTGEPAPPGAERPA